ncbi:MAG: hypothetical protein DRP29_07265 [Thermodesulfobacteriota bacterium]|nr:MAG: hypothetical protein DRP29_07265 [Thermodesulfobacteriota bacterium]
MELKEVKRLLEEILKFLRERYEVIDDLIRLLFPYKTNEEIAEEVAEKVKKMSLLQQEYYLERLSSYAEFLFKYYLIEEAMLKGEEIKEEGGEMKWM